VIFAFADCELDRALYQLRRRGRVIKLEPKVFDVLAHLLEHRDRVVTRHELLDALRRGEALSESVLPRAIAAARRALGDTRARARVIETVHGRGYRFVAVLREAPLPGGEPEPVPPAPGPAFVGRARTLERLERALDAALAARGRLVLLAGEPGIGKTRTAEEIARVARERGAEVVVGRCFEGEGAPAFWPWLQLLRDLVARAEPARLRAALAADGAELAQLVPELRARLPSLPPAARLEGEQARFRLFDALTGFLHRRAQQGPLVLVLDDLHWADEASLLGLEFVAPELGSAALLVVATFRDVELRRDHPLSKLLGALARVPACERISLRGLEPAEVAALVEAVAGEAPSAGVARAVHEMTEGNPFFAFEIARLLAETGLPAERPSTLALPQSVRDAIGRRLDGLSAACNEALRAAAVLGRGFDLALLARVTERPPEALLDLLGEALAAGVLVETEEQALEALALAAPEDDHALLLSLAVAGGVAAGGLDLIMPSLQGRRDRLGRAAHRPAQGRRLLRGLAPRREARARRGRRRHRPRARGERLRAEPAAGRLGAARDAPPALALPARLLLGRGAPVRALPPRPRRARARAARARRYAKLRRSSMSTSHSSSATRRPLAAITMDGTEPSRCALAWPARPRPQRSVPIAFHQRKRAASKRPPAAS
jgi:DNA-binding winged helix-turn-helix (wHTH) protein